jgi:uncharacterized protein (DUF2225 family)
MVPGETTVVDPAPAELLHYLPDYKVLVCTSCQYAVQPSAIQRHLKEIHEIKRGRRRPFTEYTNKLQLDSAETVIARSM